MFTAGQSKAIPMRSAYGPPGRSRYNLKTRTWLTSLVKINIIQANFRL
jgi:hypothetical protein